jgi:hypothetical protein
VLAPLVRQTFAAGLADRWFFIRFGDPDWYVRVRIRGDPRLRQAEGVQRVKLLGLRMILYWPAA